MISENQAKINLLVTENQKLNEIIRKDQEIIDTLRNCETSSMIKTNENEQLQRFLKDRDLEIKNLKNILLEL